MPMLRCASCRNSFHQVCFKKPIADEAMPCEVSWAHEFICAGCNSQLGQLVGEEKLTLYFPGWREFAVMMMASIHLEGVRRGIVDPIWVYVRQAPDDPSGLNVEAFADRYMDRYGATRSKTWINTLAAAIHGLKYGYVIKGTDVDGQLYDGFWSLRRLVEGWPGDVIPLHICDSCVPKSVAPKYVKLQKEENTSPEVIGSMVGEGEGSQKKEKRKRRSEVGVRVKKEFQDEEPSGKRRRREPSRAMVTMTTTTSTASTAAASAASAVATSASSSQLSSLSSSSSSEVGDQFVDRVGPGLELFRNLHAGAGFARDQIQLMWDGLQESQRDDYRAQANIHRLFN